MTKAEKLANHFPEILESIYPDSKLTPELAARIVASHLLILTVAEVNIYLRKFFAFHGEALEIFSNEVDQNEAIVSFIKMVQGNLPDNVDEINTRLKPFLSNISDKQVSHIVSYCQIKNYSESHISFAEILFHPEQSIKSHATLRQLIKKLGINVISLDDKYKNGKFISHADHQRILKVYQPRS